MKKCTKPTPDAAQGDLALPEPVGKVTSAEVIALLAERHPSPQWSFLREVRNTTGWAKDIRSADAMVMGAWPSTGLELQGFEVKVSRGDWLRELKDPTKAQAISQFCHRWWLVIGSSKVALPTEVPKTWGLMVVEGSEPHARRLRVLVDAPKLDAKPLDNLFVASLVRNALDSTLVPEERQRIAVEYAQQTREGIAKAHRGVEERLAEGVQKVRAFEQKTGLSILGDYGGPYIDALAFFTNGASRGSGVGLMRQRLLSMATDLERFVEHLRRTAASFDEIEKLISQMGRGAVVAEDTALPPTGRAA